jgi:hypothetical protein
MRIRPMGFVVVVVMATIIGFLFSLEFSYINANVRAKVATNKVVLTPTEIGTFKMGLSICSSYRLDAHSGEGLSSASWVDTHFIVCNPPLAGYIQGSSPGKNGTP